jgi:uncharacterized protein YcbX
VSTVASLACLHVYPLKSARGVDLGSARLVATGLEHDRQWLVTDAAGRFLTQRELPRLALLGARIEAGVLELSAPQLAPLRVPTAAAATPCRVRIWKDECPALDAGDVAADWLRLALGTVARLVRFDAVVERPSDPAWTAGLRALNQFSDGFPILVANRASLDALNAALPTPLPMTRFRPNLVVAGLQPWEEDRIAELAIGQTRLRLVKPCTRCRITTIDPQVGAPDGEEPLHTLKRLRYDSALRGVTFAWNAVIVAGVGTTLTVGQRVEPRPR